MSTAQTWSANDIAIIGMACRVPGATTPDQFWSLLREARESRIDLDDDALRAAGVAQEVIDNPNYVKATMPLQHMEHFDPGFFGFSPLDARILDPQHRHFLECSWEALEDAGHDPTRFGGAVGVFAGSGHNAYLAYNLLSNPELVADVGFFLLRHTGNDKDFLATRVSYCLDLRGPSVNIQTACSTSLVAIHAAAQSLINGECDMALAGGVTIELPHRQGYLYKDSEILSQDGHCRPFDVSAGGTVFGSGVGVVVLRRMEDAIADRDNIHAVLRASAVNNDGAGKVSYLAPSVDGQAAAIQEALAIGEIDPRSVSYVEAHGTGTQLGDPIEVAALSQAYGSEGGTQFCGLGSVKSNIGHLDTAAGIASLIKVLLAMRHRELPPTLHWTAANEGIEFANTPFRVQSTLEPWTATGPLRAGVSSLGVGGTNAHLIVEEAPRITSSVERRQRQLMPFSARSETALLRSLDRTARHIERADELGQPTDLADVAYTLAIGRRAFRRRAFLLASDAAEAVLILDAGDRDRLLQAEAPASERTTVFMFAGGGAQHPNMGRGLYEHEPVYRAAIDECVALLRGFVDYDLLPLLYPPDEAALRDAERTLERPTRTLPALFVTQYAQARLWQSWGVQPAALIGHSMGENTAACIAGVLSLRDALGLVALRGKLFEAVDAGSMLSVDLDEAELTPLLGDSLCIAAINAPGLAVASGPREAIAKLEAQLVEREIGHRRIRIDVAAHSQMLDGILEEFGAYLRRISLRPPSIPFVSNRTGTWITDTEATDASYWVAHLRHTVRFADGAATLLRGQHVLLEVGPGRTLASLASAHREKRADQAILASMRHPDDTVPDDTHMLTTMGRLWLAGIDVDWQRFYGPDNLPGQQRRRVSLPTYAFDHQPCWVDPGNASLGAANSSGSARARGATLADWLYQPVWQRTPTPLSQSNSLHGARVLLFAAAGNAALIVALERALHAHGATVRVVGDSTAGQRRPVDSTDALELLISDADDYVRLGDRLRQEDALPTHILHTLCLDLADAPSQDTVERARAFDSLFHLARVAGQEDWQDLQWLVVTSGAQQVASETLGNPLAALALGPMRVLPREFSSWRCATVDVEPAACIGAPATTLAAQIVGELASLPAAGVAGSTIALRGHRRFELTLRPPLRAANDDRDAGSALPVLHDGAAYLVTGGTGGLGLIAARALERTAAATGIRITLILLARRALPAPEHWSALRESNAAEAELLRTLSSFADSAADIVLETGDVTDFAAMRSLAHRLKDRYGGIRGVLHTAGVVDDALLLGKEISNAAGVLSPKVNGTLALAEAFDLAALDFMALYSSTSAFIGLPGQIDYAAANAFQDAFAEYANARGANVVAIDWPAWRDAGMAANLARGESAMRLPAGRPLTHPLLDRCIDEDHGRFVVATDFSVSRHWVLSEHRLVNGPALLPGSAFVELARASWLAAGIDAAAAAVRGVHIEDALFELPFVVGDTEHKALTVELSDVANGSARFVLRSESFGDTVEHVRGRVASFAADAIATTLDLDAIAVRCRAGEQRFDDPDHHPFLDFGPRWRALERVRYGVREALIELKLPSEYEDELSEFGLHPALYDMATAGAQVIIDGYVPRESFYVPVGCARLRFRGRFPAHSIGHVTYRGPNAAEPDLAVFDVSVGDTGGRVFLEVEGFTLRRVPDVNAFRQLAPRLQDGVAPSLARTLELGIDAREGAQSLLHVLGADLGPRVVVSPHRLDFLQSELLARFQTTAPVNTAPAHDPDADPDIATVEVAFRDCAAVDEIAVRAFLEATGERRFVAWFVPDFTHFTTTAEIRKFARSVLPPELLPQQFVELDELTTRTPDGAIDRSVLRDPLAPTDAYIAPRTTTEKTIARIWQDALGVARVGLTDNFFDLGGHSLLSTRIIVQIYKRLGVRLDQATIVLNTLEQIAHDVEQRKVTTPTVVAPGEQTRATTESNSAYVSPKDSAQTRAGRGLLRSLFGGKS